jgi:hypothetical protein
MHQDYLSPWATTFLSTKTSGLTNRATQWGQVSMSLLLSQIIHHHRLFSMFHIIGFTRERIRCTRPISAPAAPICFQPSDIKSTATIYSLSSYVKRPFNFAQTNPHSTCLEFDYLNSHGTRTAGWYLENMSGCFKNISSTNLQSNMCAGWLCFSRRLYLRNCES